MKEPTSHTPQQIGYAAKLRRRAEELLQASSPDGLTSEPDADPRRLLHELQVQRIELELQNEALREAQAGVHAAMERYTDFHDFSPVGLFTLQEDGAIIQVSLTGARLLGLERSRLIGLRFGTFLTDAARAVFDSFLRGMFAGEARRSCELELTIDGQPSRIVQINARLSPDRQECRAVAVDITGQKQVERALRESERRFRDVADVSADWIWEVDMAGRYTYASESVRTLLGYTQDELIGKSAFDLMPADEAERVQEQFSAVALRGEPFRDLANIVVDVIGGRHYTLTSGTPTFDAAGNTIGYRGVDRDITAHRQAEEALKASQQRFRDIVNTTEGIVWEADAETLDVTFISQQAERLLGYPIEDWRQPGFWARHLHPDDKDWAAEYRLSCTRRGVPYDLEYRFEARDGSTVWLHDIVTVVEEDGVPRWLRGIMVDITRRRHTEEKLIELAESLETKVMERTRELRNLSAQLTMTEERERRMLAQDLHDNLGQLLAVIKIKLTAIHDESRQPSIAQIIDLAEKADRAARHISQQLSPPILRTLGLVPALEWLAEEMERVYGLVVHLDFDECCKPHVDDIQAVLYRSARELLINVAKYAGVKEAWLICLCDSDRLSIVVSDAGCGFEPADYVGEQMNQNTFGLRSIYERIINLGGKIDIDSSPGNGTMVTLSVPRFTDEKEICDDPDNAGR